MDIVYTDIVESSTITASSEEFEGDADKVGTNVIGDRWFSGTATANEWVKFQLPTSRQSSYLAVQGLNNITSSVTFVLEAHSADTWASPSYSKTITHSTIQDDEGIIEYLDPGPGSTYGWYRLKITKAAAGDLIGIGRVFLGLAVSMKDPMVGFSSGQVDLSIVDETPSGQKFAEDLGQKKTFSANIANLTTTQKTTLEALFRAIGTAKPFLLSVDHSAFPYEDIFGFLESIPIFTHTFLGADGNHRWSTTFSMRSA